MNTYRRPPVVFTHGRGCRLYDSQGREYLDFLAGIAVNALGYAHPRIVRVIRREAGRATHISNLFHNPYQGAAGAEAGGMVGPRSRVFHQQRHGGDRRRAETGAGLRARKARAQRGPRRRRASWRSKIRFTAARSARFRSPIRRNIASRSSRWFPAWNSFASTMWRPRGEIRRHGLRHRHRADSRRRRNFPDQRGILAAGARARDAVRCRVDRRRNSIRPGTHRPLFRLSEISTRCRTSSPWPSRLPAACRSALSSPTKNSPRHFLRGCTARRLAADRWSAPRRSNF